MSAWKVTVTKSGRYTAQTEGNYVDRNIEIDVPDGAAAVDTGQVLAVTPSLAYDSASGKIVATVNGSGTVSGSVSRAGWIAAVQPAAVSASGSVSAAPEEILPIMTDAQAKSYLGI